MEPNDLKVFELEYELLSRGIVPENNQLRRRAQLRAVLAKEKSGVTYIHQVPYQIHQEFEEIDKTLLELFELVTSNDIPIMTTLLDYSVITFPV